MLENAGLVVMEEASRPRHCRLGVAQLDEAMARIGFYRRRWARRVNGLDAYFTLQPRPEGTGFMTLNMRITRRLAATRVAVVALGGAAAVMVNLIVYSVGRTAGGTFRFTSSSGPAEVDAVTVAGFSAVPLLIGLGAVALLASFAAWVIRAALVIGPVLAVGTIALMTLPTDLDAASKVTLALCHLTLIPITIAAVVAIGRRAQAIRATKAIPS